MDDRPVCPWPMDADGFGRLEDLDGKGEPCRIPAGFKGWRSNISLLNDDGTPADSDDVRSERKPKNMASHTKHVDEAPVASVEVADAPPDLKAFMPADGKLTGANVAMALIALAGSGAVLKLVKDWLDKRAELKEKELENQQSQHATCDAARAADATRTQEALAALSVRIDDVELRIVKLFKKLKQPTKKKE